MGAEKEHCFVSDCERRVGIRNAQSVQIKGQWHVWHTCLYHMRIIEHMTPEELLELADDQENLALLREEKAQQAENTL